MKKHFYTHYLFFFIYIEDTTSIIKKILAYTYIFIYLFFSTVLLSLLFPNKNDQLSDVYIAFIHLKKKKRAEKGWIQEK